MTLTVDQMMQQLLQIVKNESTPPTEKAMALLTLASSMLIHEETHDVAGQCIAWALTYMPTKSLTGFDEQCATIVSRVDNAVKLSKSN